MKTSIPNGKLTRETTEYTAVNRFILALKLAMLLSASIVTDSLWKAVNKQQFMEMHFSALKGAFLTGWI